MWKLTCLVIDSQWLYLVVGQLCYYKVIVIIIIVIYSIVIPYGWLYLRVKGGLEAKMILWAYFFHFFRGIV